MTEPTRLQLEIADRVLQIIHEDGLQAGARLNENGLAKRLKVSRTPVRAALGHLEGRGIVLRHPNRGVELVGDAPLPGKGGAPASDEVDHILVRIARDRESGTLGGEISELEMMRRYGLGRADVQRSLARLAELEMVERKPGYGWRFLHEISDRAVRTERYRFRMLIEPMGFFEPGFQLDREWSNDMLVRHRDELEKPWSAFSSVAFYEMNAAFHEGLAAASGNRFVLSAIRRENQLRRLSNYNWNSGLERVHVSCREHIAILERLLVDDRELASILMRRHLEGSNALRHGAEHPRSDP